MLLKEEREGLLGPEVPDVAPAGEQLPAAAEVAELESEEGHCLLIHRSSDLASAQEWVQRRERGEFGTAADALHSFICGGASWAAMVVAADAIPAGGLDSMMLRPGDAGSIRDAGPVIYRLPFGAGSQNEATPAVRIMSLRGLSREGLSAAMGMLGQMRAERLRTAGPCVDANDTDPKAAAMAAWMASQGGGKKKKRNPIVDGLCCIVSPIHEFASEFVGAGVWQPIRDFCASKPETTATAAASPQPSEAGVLDMQVAARPIVAGKTDDDEVTIFVRTTSAATMRDFSALWTETVLPAAVATQAGSAPPAPGSTEDVDGVEVQPQAPRVDRFERPYVDAVRALTTYAEPWERLLIFLAVLGLGFNAGAISQVASITSRIIVSVLQEDFDKAQDASLEIAMWGGIFACVQLSAYLILERMAEVLSARFRRHYFKAMLRQDQVRRYTTILFASVTMHLHRRSC